MSNLKIENPVTLEQALVVIEMLDDRATLAEKERDELFQALKQVVTEHPYPKQIWIDLVTRIGGKKS